MFRKGQKVVCINDQFDEAQIPFFDRLPEEDVVYTIRDCFVTTRNLTIPGKLAVLLEEIVNTPIEHPNGVGSYEPNFSADRFVDLRELSDSEEFVVAVEVEEEMEFV